MRARSALAFSPGAAGPALAAADTPRDWRDLARCTELDPDLFFPEAGVNAGPARAVCRGCEVRVECLASAFALSAGATRVRGVWGGFTERQIQALQRDGVAAEAAVAADDRARASLREAA